MRRLSDREWARIRQAVEDAQDAPNWTVHIDGWAHGWSVDAAPSGAVLVTFERSSLRPAEQTG